MFRSALHPLHHISNASQTSLRRSPQASSPPISLRRTLSSQSTPKNKKQNRLPASYYRGGTSRAIFFQPKDLPPNRTDWDPIFLGVLGSPDPNGRQLDGLGGGISSLSKICVVGPSSRENADVDYTFAAIGVRDDEVDYSSNCGNMTSAVGAFAVDSGLFNVDADSSSTKERDITVRIHNTNTGKIIHSTLPVAGGEAVASGDFAIDGVAGTPARVKLAFINPAGSKTGKLLPTGNVTDVLDGVKATCIDAGNPCVFINAESVKVDGRILPDEVEAHPTLLAQLDSIRRKAAVAMSICKDEASTPGSIPKIAMVSPAKPYRILSGEMLQGDEVDLVVRALSVGQPHRAVPITVAMAIAAAANIKGSTVNDVVSENRADAEGITLGHSSGRIVVGAEFNDKGELTQATVFRTARKIMEGIVFWK